MTPRHVQLSQFKDLTSNFMWGVVPNSFWLDNIQLFREAFYDSWTELLLCVLTSALAYDLSLLPAILKTISPYLPSIPAAADAQPTVNSLLDPYGRRVGSWQPCRYRVNLSLKHDWIMVQEWIPDPGWANSRSFPENQDLTYGRHGWIKAEWALKENQKLWHSSPTIRSAIFIEHLQHTGHYSQHLL